MSLANHKWESNSDDFNYDTQALVPFLKETGASGDVEICEKDNSGKLYLKFAISGDTYSLPCGPSVKSNTSIMSLHVAEDTEKDSFFIFLPGTPKNTTVHSKITI
jgi:hypothetical protein